MACRNMDSCESARNDIINKTFNKQVHCRKLDLNSFKSVREFSTEFNNSAVKRHNAFSDIRKTLMCSLCSFSAEDRLDVLINNAGFMNSKTSRKTSEDHIEEHLQVNYLSELFAQISTNILIIYQSNTFQLNRP